MNGKSLVVIGGGIVGLATAMRIQERFPRCRITVLEKEPAIARHQSTHNSGVMHAGLYYKPGTLKAQLAVEGLRLMVRFCRENDVPHQICGKIVVATTPTEIPGLEGLLARGIANGLAGLRLLTREGIRDLEPYAAGVAALHVPEEGIVDYGVVCSQMSQLFQSRGGLLCLNRTFLALCVRNQQCIVDTSNGTLSTDFAIACAGLHSDRVAQRSGEKPTLRIIPFRGEYYRLLPQATHLVRNLIYPVPNPEFPFLGVHFTRMIGGGIEAGPNAVLAFAREGYSATSVNLRDSYDILSFPGFWRFLKRYHLLAFQEIWQSASKRRFVENLQRLVPDLSANDLEKGPVGVRAQAMRRDGEIAHDFAIVSTHGRVIHVLNAPSPAATASIAIGDHIASMIA